MTAALADSLLEPLTLANQAKPPAPWRVVGIPDKNMALTTFTVTALDGRNVLRLEAPKSYGNLVHPLPTGTAAAGLRLAWRWRLDQGLPAADLRTRAGDDSPLKVCVLFDMPLDRLGVIERNLFRLARAASAEDLPSASLCYVWNDRLAPDTLLTNAYSARVRMLVVSAGAPYQGQWQAHVRDLTADFRRAFGHETETVPPLMAVLVGADSDNTGGHSIGFVDDLRLER